MTENSYCLILFIGLRFISRLATTYSVVHIFLNPVARVILPFFSCGGGRGTFRSWEATLELVDCFETLHT